MTTNDKPFAPKTTAVVALAALMALPLASIAESLGKNEVSGSLSYNDIEDVSTTSATLSYGRYLTDMHQVGVTAGYVDMEYDGASVDGTTLGAFYHLNIPLQGIVKPYLGVNVATLGGDLGDYYDFSYGAGAGVKIYAFKNAGINIGVAYQKYDGKNGWDDADGASVNVGLMMRF